LNEKADDRRLQRLETERPTRRRHIAEPEILKEEDDEDEDKDEENELEDMELEDEYKKSPENVEEEEEIDAEAKVARRLALKQKALQRQEV